MIPANLLGRLLGDHESSARYGLGLICIVSVALIWAASSVLVQYMYSNYAFDSPFLLTYIGVALFTWPLPMKYITNKLIQPCFEASVDTCQAAVDVADIKDTCTSYCQMTETQVAAAPHDDTCNTSVAEITTGSIQQTPERQRQGNADNDDLLRRDGSSHEDQQVQGVYMLRGTSTTTTSQWSRAKHMQTALQIAPVWFLANWSYNGALFFTSVASSTVLMSTCSLFAFMFAVWIRNEGFQWIKLGGVLLGILGAALTAYHDYQDETCFEQCRYALVGDGLAVTAALSFGTYAVQIRMLCPRNEELYSMQSLLGYIGLVNMIVLSPIAVWRLTGQSHSMTVVVFGLIIVRGVFDYVLSEYLYFRAVVFTSATVATLGLTLTIPLAFLADHLVGNEHILSLSSVLGAAAVVGGFFLVNVGNADEKYEKDLKESLHEELKRTEQAQAFLKCHAWPCGCFVDTWIWDENDLLMDDAVVSQEYDLSNPEECVAATTAATESA